MTSDSRKGEAQADEESCLKNQLLAPQEGQLCLEIRPKMIPGLASPPYHPLLVTDSHSMAKFVTMSSISLIGLAQPHQTLSLLNSFSAVVCVSVKEHKQDDGRLMSMVGAAK